MPPIPTHLFTEHPEFFFPDGNVVLIAGRLVFRLHRGIVNRWSPAFTAMLDGLDAATDPWTFDGNDVIVLDDDARDVERLVRVLHDGSGNLTSNAMNFPIISSLLILSHKYCITQLNARVLGSLLVAYPVTLADWDVREAYIFAPAARYERLSGLRARFVHPLAVVSLALHIEAPFLLLPAYLDLARFPVSEIIRGYATLVPTASISPTSTTSQILHLPRKQTTAVLRGKETLQRFIADFIKVSVENYQPSPLCRYMDMHIDAEGQDHIHPCATAFTRVAHEMLVMTAGVSGGVDSDPLFVLRCAIKILEESGRKSSTVLSVEIQGEEDTEKHTSGPQTDAEGVSSLTYNDERSGNNRETQTEGACVACTAEFTQHVEMARQHVWRNLGKWFDLRKILEHGFEAGEWE